MEICNLPKPTIYGTMALHKSHLFRQNIGSKRQGYRLHNLIVQL